MEILAIVAEIANKLSFFVIVLIIPDAYLTINKQWHRRTEKAVAESISIMAKVLGLSVCMITLINNFFHDVWAGVITSIIWSIVIVIQIIIGSGYWCHRNNRLSLILSGIKSSLRMETTEIGSFASDIFKRKQAISIIEILKELAYIDENLDVREKDLIQQFADNQNIEIDWDNIKPPKSEQWESYLNLKYTMKKYLAQEKPSHQHVKELSLLLELLIKADNKVTSEEKSMVSELFRMLEDFVTEDDKERKFEVAVIPQVLDQVELIAEKLPHLKFTELPYGKAYLSDTCYSRLYADDLCANFRSSGYIAVVLEDGNLA